MAINKLCRGQIISSIKFVAFGFIIVALIIANGSSGGYPDPMLGHDENDPEMVEVRKALIDMQNKHCEVAMRRCKHYVPFDQPEFGGAFPNMVNKCIVDILLIAKRREIPDSCCLLKSFKRLCDYKFTDK